MNIVNAVNIVYREQHKYSFDIWKVVKSKNESVEYRSYGIHDIHDLSEGTP